MFSREALIDRSRPALEAVGLPYLSAHVPSLLRSRLLWWSLQLLSHAVSPRLFPHTFHGMPKRTRTQWDIHFVSLVHSTVIAPLAIYFWLHIDESTDRVWGYDYKVGQMYTLSLSYFVWDVVVSLRYEAFAFILHGALGLLAATLVFKPLLMFDGMGVLIWEASTPFLNIHWFLDKLKLTGSRLQFVNAVFLCVTYVGVRLILGVYISYSIISNLWLADSPRVAMLYRLIYTLGLPVLNFLNYMWFIRMLRAMHKRFATVQDKKTQ